MFSCFYGSRFKSLKDENGSWITEENEIEEHITQYFQSLFSTTNPSDPSIFLQSLNQSLSHEERSFLDQEVDLEEIKRALFQMDPDKAPGPDDFSDSFY